jgi:phosphoglycolate phosphatase
VGQVLSAQPALIFDLDGTIVHSLPDVCLSINDALAQRGRGSVSLEYVHDVVGKGGIWLSKMVLEATGEPGTEEEIQSLFDDFLKIYAARPAAVSELFPNALETLSALQAAEYRMSICTNKPRGTAEPVLKHFDLSRYFELVSCGDDVPKRKPDPAHLTSVLDAMNVAAEQAIMIGDSDNDIHCAVAAGVPSIFVTFGYSHASGADLGATLSIDDLSELPVAVARLSGL